MLRRTAFALSVVTLLATGGAGYYGYNELQRLNIPLAERIFVEARDGVIHIQNGNHSGTGFFIDENLIVTNYHVVKGENDLFVRAYNSEADYAATVISFSEDHDVALVKLKDWDLYKQNETPKYLKLSNDTTHFIGERVIAMGHPWGLEWSVSEGVISGRNRMAGMPVLHLQVDAKIYGGNSGGPLINEKGEVIGMNTFIKIADGGSYGFAIPSEYIKKVITDLINHKVSKIPYIGILMGLTEDKKSVIVKDLQPDGSARECGLEPGDKIKSIKTEIADTQIKTRLDVLQSIFLLSIDQKTVTFTIERNDKEMKLTCDLKFKIDDEPDANKE